VFLQYLNNYVDKIKSMIRHCNVDKFKKFRWINTIFIR